MTDRLAALRADTGRSAAALEALVESWVEQPAPAGPIRFVGLGSSRYAALTVAAELGARGRVARVEAASRDPLPRLREETVFVVSASGRTREALDAADALEVGGPVIAVTNDLASPLARGRHAIGLRAGTEESGIATLTFRATLAALGLATGATTPSAVRRAGPSLPTAEPWVAGAADLLDGAPSIDVIAGEPLTGVAEQGALMLREGPRLRAVAWPAPEWLHTAVYTALPLHAAVFVGASEHEGEIAGTIEGRGGIATRVPRGDHGPIAEAIATSVAFELLAAELWDRATRPRSEARSGPALKPP